MNISGQTGFNNLTLATTTTLLDNTLNELPTIDPNMVVGLKDFEALPHPDDLPGLAAIYVEDCIRLPSDQKMSCISGSLYNFYQDIILPELHTFDVDLNTGATSSSSRFDMKLDKFEDKIKSQDGIVVSCVYAEDVTLDCFERNGMHRIKTSYKMFDAILDCPKHDEKCNKDIVRKSLQPLHDALSDAKKMHERDVLERKNGGPLVGYYAGRKYKKFFELKKVLATIF